MGWTAPYITRGSLLFKPRDGYFRPRYFILYIIKADLDLLFRLLLPSFKDSIEHRVKPILGSEGNLRNAVAEVPFYLFLELSSSDKTEETAVRSSHQKLYSILL